MNDEDELAPAAALGFNGMIEDVNRSNGSDNSLEATASLLSVESHGQQEQELNYQTLLQLQANDPTVKSVHAHWKEGAFINRVVWAEKIGAIGHNTRLKKLTLEILDTSYRPDGYQVEKNNFEAFCNGLAMNRSIEQLSIIGFCQCSTRWMEILSPFIEHNNSLRCLVTKGYRMNLSSSQLLASVLSKRANKSSITRIGLVNGMNERRGSVELIASLNQYYSLVHLNLGGNRIGLSGCIELGKLLRNPESQLKELHLECSNIDDKSIEVLVNGALFKNRRLKKLSLSQNFEITASGWRTLSGVLRNPLSALEALYLAETSLDDNGLAWIGSALSFNSTLKVLDLYCNERINFDGWRPFFRLLQDNPSCAVEELNLGENNINDEVAVALFNTFARVRTFKFLRLNDTETIWSLGWQAISNLLQNHNATLVELDLNMNNIDNEGAISLANALANSPSLRILDLGSNSLIHAAGWRALSVCFQNSILEEINLSENRIDDEVAVLLANSFAAMPTLKSLNLCGLHYVTANGWRSVLAALGNAHSSLEELKLPINSIDDEGAVSFANALVNNSSLKTIDLDANQLISDIAWQAFSQLVCHKSSVMSTFLSNHTLHQLCDQNAIDLPRDLWHSLHFNKGADKKKVARHKIIWAHFQGEVIDPQAFVDMELQVMPQALDWIGRDYVGHSLFYQLVRTMPSLIELGTK